MLRASRFLERCTKAGSLVILKLLLAPIAAVVKFAIQVVCLSEKVEKSSKLLKNTVKIGDETRTILSGIAKYYTPEQMVGKRVVVVANLKPRMMCGYESSGMILCAEKQGKVVLVTPEEAIDSGAEVC